ncbi:hypothetical protein FZEAL_10398 [Fusarium zealandicum]|uniref:Endonuclease/exonuclease/phosphatase domain-containing protein n=1 Tax=Fusarium zealandicum TaxID=1053134 RepID=A0A8H4XAX2_9HYPO|nr:hypothetical protein FZEAL_10398 [Fusarium zealandicum]
MTRLHDISPGTSLRMDISASSQRMPLRIVTFNVRYATKHPVHGEKPWSLRCPKLVTQLAFITAGHESPFVCLQECLHSQIQDIQERLGDGWAHIGRGRGENEHDGEFSPIFYRNDVWQCDRFETRWLSKTPDKPSRGWDAALNRIVTMGEFSHRVTGTRVVVMSTHFDHLGVKAREHSAGLLIKFAQEWGSSGDRGHSAVLIGGDFNSATDEGAYKFITAPDSGISDLFDLVPKSGHYGNEITYTSFGEGYNPSRIDFLFIQEPRTAHVKTFGVLANAFDDDVRVSDHRPVVSDLDIVV